MQRITSIDIAKGIAIILVILAHTLPEERGGLREIIYSFHMPLFFILSGYTQRYSTNFKEAFSKSLHTIKKLGIPLISLWIVFTIYAYNTDIYSYSSIRDFTFKKLQQLLYASGVTGSQLVIFGGGNIEAIGFPWFFAALMGSKIIYDAIQVYFKKLMLLAIVTMLSFMGVFAGKMYHFPLCLDISFAVLLFLWIGHQMKNYSILFGVKRIAVLFLIWGFLWVIINRYGDWGLEIAGRSYPLFPLCFIEAFTGTMVIILFSNVISKHNSYLSSQLELWGRCSLNILIIHCIDFLWKDITIITDFLWLNIILRIFFDLTLFYIYRTLKSRYSLKWKVKKR